MAERLERGCLRPYDDVLADIRARDARDQGRSTAPLVQAGDAVLVDTSDLGIEAAIAEAISVVEHAMAANDS